MDNNIDEAAIKFAKDYNEIHMAIEAGFRNGKIIDSFIAGAKWQSSQPTMTLRWVKASERLPEKVSKGHESEKWKRCKTVCGAEILSMCYYNHKLNMWFDGFNAAPEERVYEWFEEQPTVTEDDGWVSEKPEIKEDCIVLTAQWFEDYKYWEYKIWVVEKQYTNEGWYWGLFTGDGDHWGVFADLEAKKYKIIMHPPQPPKTIK